MYVNIVEPCNQNWEQMEKLEGGNFCNACRKCVIDFSEYTNEAILHTLKTSKTAICGRLSQKQLNSLNYSLIVHPSSRTWMKYFGVLAIGTSIFVQDAQGALISHRIEQLNLHQKVLSNSTPPKVKIIHGYLFDVNNKPLKNIKVFITNTNLFAVTDANGRYEIQLDRVLNLRNNLLIANDTTYHGELKLNILKEKQANFKVKKVDSMIMGEIRITPRKSNY
jgi:hypothetical protein